MTPRIPPRQRTAVDADHHDHGGWTQFITVSVWAGDFSTCRKPQFYLGLPHLHLAPPLGKIPLEFRIGLLRRKTEVFGLSCSVVFKILRLAFLIQYRVVTDGRTDRHAMTANAALALRRADKNVSFKAFHFRLTR